MWVGAGWLLWCSDGGAGARCRLTAASPILPSCPPAPQLQQLHAAVQELLTARHSAQLHAAALQELKGTYQVRGLHVGWGADGLGLAVSAGEHEQKSVHEVVQHALISLRSHLTT